MIELIRSLGVHGLSETWPKVKGLRWLSCLLLIISLPGVGFPQTPQTIKIVAVTKSADFQPGPPQPGSLSSIFVTGLQGEQGITTARKYPLSNELNAVSVWTDSLPAPILAIAFFDGYQQINVQVPWEDANPKIVQVAQNGIQAQTTAASANSLESIFFSDGNGYGVMQHASDYSLVTAQNPAHPGEYLIAYAQDLGPVLNRPATGAPSPFDPLGESILTAPVGCSVNDNLQIGPTATAAPTYKGLTPGTVGVYQVNFQLPSSVSTGDLPVSFERNAFSGSALFPCTPNPAFLSRSVLLPIR